MGQDQEEKVRKLTKDKEILEHLKQINEKLETSNKHLKNIDSIGTYNFGFFVALTSTLLAFTLFIAVASKIPYINNLHIVGLYIVYAFGLLLSAIAGLYVLGRVFWRIRRAKDKDKTSKT